MSQQTKGKVRAIGGVFFRSQDPSATRDWYAKHLGIQTDAYGSNFAWRHANAPEKKGHTQWSPFAEDTQYFGDTSQQFMINYRVDDLEALLAHLRKADVTILGEIQEESYGKFIHIVDGDGRRVELWEPVDETYETIVEGTVE